MVGLDQLRVFFVRNVSIKMGYSSSNGKGEQQWHIHGPFKIKYIFTVIFCLEHFPLLQR